MHDFIYSIQKKDKPRKHIVKNSWLMKDYYRNYKRHYGTKLSQREFTAIFQDIMYDLIRRYLLTYAKLVLPYKMGYFTMLQMDYTKRDYEGNLKWKKLVDWKATLDSWENDRELYNERVRSYTLKPTGVAIKYVKPDGSFRNHKLYKFKLSRKMSQILYGKSDLN